jgi:hypothetical protein
VRYVRMLGMCLAAMLVLVAVCASGASALPEWGRCVAQAGGKYTDSNCTTVYAKPKAAGSYEWLAGAAEHTAIQTDFGSGEHMFFNADPAVLTADFKGCSPSHERRPGKCSEGEEETHSQIAVECTEDSTFGLLRGSTANIGVYYTGCTDGPLTCANARGTTDGGFPEIVTDGLSGKLGYLDQAKREVGMLMRPVVKRGAVAIFNCGGVLNVTVGAGNAKKEGCAYEAVKGCGNDGFVTKMEPVNRMSEFFTQSATVNGELENVPQLEKGKRYDLEAYDAPENEQDVSSEWSRAGLQMLAEWSVSAGEEEIKG